MVTLENRLLAAGSTVLIILLIFVILTAWGSAAFTSDGQPGRPFNHTIFVGEIDGCISMAQSRMIDSPDKRYTLAHAVLCLDSERDPWNLSFVAGVASMESSLFEYPPNWPWTFPVSFHQPTRGGTVRFTETGDLQYVVPVLKEGESLMPPWTEERVIWNTNTSGMGGVELQIQDTGNLVIVHSDGKTVVWKALDIPLLPLSRLSAAARTPLLLLVAVISAAYVSSFLLYLT